MNFLKKTSHEIAQKFPNEPVKVQKIDHEKSSPRINSKIKHSSLMYDDSPTLSAPTPLNYQDKLSASLKNLTIEPKSDSPEAITPDQYLAYLNNPSNNLPANIVGSYIIPVDLRPFEEFASFHVLKSINMNLPPLILKRLKSGLAPGFQIESFLTSNECKTKFRSYLAELETLTQAKPTKINKIYIMIYDDETLESSDSDTWNFIEKLSGGIATNILKNNPNLLAKVGDIIQVAYLKNGINAFVKLTNMDQHIMGLKNARELGEGLISTMEPHEGSLNSFSEETDDTLDMNTVPNMKLAGRRLTGISGKITPKTKKRSLSVNTAPRTGSSPIRTMEEHLASALSKKPDGNEEIEDSTPTMSGICSAFSQILPFLLLGSETLPTAATAVEDLKKLGVTHILNMAVDSVPREDVKQNFHLKWFKLQDNCDQEMNAHLRESVQDISIKKANKYRVI